MLLLEKKNLTSRKERRVLMRKVKELLLELIQVRSVTGTVQERDVGAKDPRIDPGGSLF